MRKSINIVIIFIVFCYIFIIIAGFRLFGIDADYYNYRDMVVNNGNVGSGTEEFAFTIIRRINDFLFDSNMRTFLLMFAILGVSIKLFAIFNYSKNSLFSLLIYFFSYFILHEYTQIRAGVATGIFMLAISDIKKGNVRKYFIKTLLAIMFHWSSLVLLPLYFIVRYFKTRFFYILPYIGIVFFLIGSNISSLIQERLSTALVENDYYNTHRGHQEEINVFNLINTSHLLIFVVASCLNLRSKNKYDGFDLVLFRIFSISLFIFYFLASFQIPVIAFRLYEYLNVVLLFLIPSIVSKFKQKFIPTIIFSIYYFIYAYHLILNTQALPDVLIFFKSI